MNDGTSLGTWASLPCIRSSSKQSQSRNASVQFGYAAKLRLRQPVPAAANMVVDLIGLMLGGIAMVRWQVYESAAAIATKQAPEATILVGDLPWFSSASRAGLLSRPKPRSARAGPFSVAFSLPLFLSNRRAEALQASAVARAPRLKRWLGRDAHPACMGVNSW